MSKYRERIAKRIAREFKDGDLVNLGIGMPTMVANYIPEDIKVILQSENGFVGLGPTPVSGQEDKDLVDAGGQPVTIIEGGSFFNSATSFSIIRGGHLDATVLGALQVDEKGDLANWMIPGKFVPGMGGAMDLTVGAKKVIVATRHVTKNGSPKILNKCSLPYTARGVVDLIVTDLAVIEVVDSGLLLKEIAKGIEIGEVIKKTEAELSIDKDLKTF